MIRIRLTRKLALRMNGVDVSQLKVGDLMELPKESADMMIENGWAERAADPLANPFLILKRTHTDRSN